MNNAMLLRLLRLLALAALLGAALAALGCVNPAQLPIFYTLETEDPVDEDRGLPEDLNAIEMVSTGTRYFLAAGSLFTRLPGASTRWAVVPPPVSGALCNTIELWDDGSGGGVKLWAGWFDQDGNGLGLWSTDPSLGSWSASDWDQDANLDDGYRIGLVKVGKPGPPSEMLVASSTGPAPYTYVLDYYEAGNTTLSPGGSLIASSSSSIVDATWDGTDYWVAAGTKLYRGNGGGDLGASIVITGITDTGDSFGGLFYDSADPYPNDLYLSTRGTPAEGGRLLRYAGLATASDSGRIEDSDGDRVPFTGFVDPDPAVAGQIYVGTQGYGYYVIPVGGSVAASGLSRKPPSNISGLYNGAVNAFLLDDKATPLDPSDDSLFVCTSGAGLWRGDFNGSDWTWKQEKSD